jgi:hypothetical protein
MTIDRFWSESYSGDDLVRRAAVKYDYASTQRGDSESRLYYRTAFLHISHLFAPDINNGDPLEQTEAWRSYMAQQYEAATGQQLALAQIELPILECLGGIVDKTFTTTADFNPINKLVRAAAILDPEHPGIIYDPTARPENFAVDAGVMLAQCDRTLAQN